MPPLLTPELIQEIMEQSGILCAIYNFWQSISLTIVPILGNLALTALCHGCISGVQAAIVAVLLIDIW